MWAVLFSFFLAANCFAPPENHKFKNLQFPQCGAFLDANNDGVYDLVSGDGLTLSTRNLVEIAIRGDDGKVKDHVLLPRPSSKYGLLNIMSVNVLDWNADGYDDVVALTNMGHVLFYLHKGNKKVEYKLEEVVEPFNVKDFESFFPGIVETVDIDNDGYKDFVIGGYSSVFNAVLASYEVTIFYGDGTGKAGRPYVVKGTRFNTFVCVSDINSDGRIDFVGIANNKLVISKQLPGRKWQTDSQYVSIRHPKAVAMTDMNEDRILDYLLYTDNADGMYSISDKNGDPTTWKSTKVPFNENPEIFVFANIDGKGHDELLVVDHPHNVIGEVSFFIYGFTIDKSGLKMHSLHQETITTRITNGGLSYNPSRFNLQDADSNGTPDLFICGLDVLGTVSVRRNITKFRYGYLREKEHNSGSKGEPRLIAKGLFKPGEMKMHATNCLPGQFVFLWGSTRPETRVFGSLKTYVFPFFVMVNRASVEGDAKFDLLISQKHAGYTFYFQSLFFDSGAKVGVAASKRLMVKIQDGK